MVKCFHRGVSTPVVCYLPKVEKRVRFSYPAHFETFLKSEFGDFGGKIAFGALQSPNCRMGKVAGKKKKNAKISTTRDTLIDISFFR